MARVYHGPILSRGPWTQADRDTVNRRLNSLVDNGPGYIRMTRDSGERINPQGGAVLASGQFQTILRSDGGNHVAVLLAGTAHDATPSTTNSAMLVQDAGVSLNTSLYILGTGKRIVGDFSNATFANRLAFQSLAANAATIVEALPNGTSNVAGFGGFSSSTPGSSDVHMVVEALATEGALVAGSPSGTFKPMTFYTSSTKQLTIDAAGLVTATQNLAWQSGTANAVTLDHAATAPRTVTFPDLSGTVLITQPPTFATGTAYALTTAFANTGASQTLGVGTWLLLGHVSWLPVGAGDVGSIGQQQFTASAGVLAQMGGSYTFAAAGNRAQTVQIATLVIAAGTATVNLQAKKNAGAGTSTAEIFGFLAVAVG